MHSGSNGPPLFGCRILLCFPIPPTSCPPRLLKIAPLPVKYNAKNGVFYLVQIAADLMISKILSTPIAVIALGSND